MAAWRSYAETVVDLNAALEADLAPHGLTLGDYQVLVHLSEADDPLASTVSATVQMASIDTGDANRDGHLRTNDFFDAEQFPTMTFTSTGITGAGSEFEVTGDLTIKGVTRPVTFDLEVGGLQQDPWGNTKAGFTLTGSINRKDFGMEYNAVLESGGVLVGDKVTIEIDVEAALQKEV
jgi:polyisoprenoid-binding protein YceI